MAQNYIFFENGRDGHADGFVDPSALIVAWDEKDVEAALAEMQRARADGKWLAGFASYELGYVLEEKLNPLLPKARKSPLICFGVFDGPDPTAARGLMHQGRIDLADARLSKPKPLWTNAEYADRFETLHDYICAGDIYQANLTFPMQAKWSGNPLGLYAALRETQTVKHGAIADLK